MRGLYYLMGAVALSVFVLGIDFIYAGNQPDTVTVEEDAVLIPAAAQPAAPVTLEGQTPNSAPVTVAPVNDANTATDNNADVVVIEEEAEEVDD
jgi:hypothetical protein